MEEIRNDRWSGLAIDFAGGKVTVVSEKDAALLAVNRERTLRRGVGQAIERHVQSRGNQKQAGNQEHECFKKSFHK
jgi:hypothetical protein